jgi:hypothetical protein
MSYHDILPPLMDAYLGKASDNEDIGATREVHQPSVP